MSAPAQKRLALFERYLTLWVALCMVSGVLLGKLLPGFVDGRCGGLEFGQGSQINLPIAVLIWLMIYPMMLKIDFASILGVRKRPGGHPRHAVRELAGEAVLAWRCSAGCSSSTCSCRWIGPELADQYIAGTIILAAAPCTAMVFVWSYLTDGDPAYTLVQVSLNDLIMLVLFAPIVGLLVAGASGLHVPFQVLLYSVVAFIVIPLALGSVSRVVLLRAKGREWFEGVFLPFFHPITTLALLATLVLIFAFQADNITSALVPRAPDRGADPDPGVLQLRAGLRAHAVVPHPAQRRGAGRADRRQQLLRAGRGRGDHAVRPRLGRGAGHGRRRAGRGAGDALGVRVLQPDPPLVSGPGNR